jgi:hypothetical protein
VLYAIALAVMMSPIHPDGESSDVFLYALFMLGPSQATLVALWAMMGGGKFVWRVLPTVLGVILCLWWFGKADREWREVTFGQFCVWGPLLLVARFTGLELVRSSVQRSALRPFQFYIRDMLMLTTAFAVILSALRCLPTDWFQPRLMPGFMVVFGSLAFVAASSLLCSLGRRWPLVRILGVPLAIIVGAYLMVAAHIGNSSVWYFAMLLGLMAAWLVASLFLVRLAGYRLAWRWRFSRNDFDAKSPDQDARHESTGVAGEGSS